MSETYQPADEFIIENLDTLKVVADPLRIDIMETVARQARRAKEIAQLVGKQPSKIYYHINLLEKHGLLQVVATRVVSGIIEKQYRISAKSIKVSPSLLLPDADHDDGINLLFSSILDRTKEDLIRGVRTGTVSLDKEAENQALFVHSRPRLTPAQFAQLQERLNDIIQELAQETAEPDSDEKQLYGLTIALYPAAGTAEKPDS